MVGFEGLILQGGLLGPETLPFVLVVAGLILTIAEALIPGANFIVLGVALLAAGLVGLVLGPVAGPLVLGLLVLAFGGIALYAYRELDVWGTEIDRTRDSTSLKGQVGRVTEQVTPTEGQVRLNEGGLNPHYAARSIDGEIPVGTEIMVVDPGGGSVVTVTPVGGDDEIDRELAAERERQRRRADEDRARERERERTEEREPGG